MLNKTSPRGMKNEMEGIPFQAETNKGYEEKITTVHIGIGKKVAESSVSVLRSKSNMAEGERARQSVQKGKTMSSPISVRIWRLNFGD